MSLKDGKVTLADLEQGCTKALGNATRLMDDAQLLFLSSADARWLPQGH
jgi:hypothetical protein